MTSCSDSDEHAEAALEESRSPVTPEIPQVDSVVEALLREVDLDVIVSKVDTLHHLFSSEKHSIERFLELDGALQKVVKLLKLDDRPDIQKGAGKVIYKILRGPEEHVDIVVKSGVCASFVALLDSPRHDVVGEAVWALSLVALKKPDFRRTLIEIGIVAALGHLLEQKSTDSVKVGVAQCLGNLSCCDSDAVPAFIITACLPVIAELLTFDCDAIVQKSCGTISEIVKESDHDFTDEFIKLDILARLVEALNSHLHVNEVIISILRTILCILEATYPSPNDTSASETVPDRASCMKARAAWDVLAGKGVIWDLTPLTKYEDPDISKLVDRLVTHYRTVKESSCNEEQLQANSLYDLGKQLRLDHYFTSVRFVTQPGAFVSVS